MNLFNKLNGYKTYIICVTTVVYAISYYGLGQHDYGTMFSMIFGASGLGCLRHGVSKTAAS